MSLKKASVAAALAVSMVSTPVLGAVRCSALRCSAQRCGHQRMRTSFVAASSFRWSRSSRSFSAFSPRPAADDRPSQPLSGRQRKRIAAFGPLFFCPRSGRHANAGFTPRPYETAAMQLTNDPRIVVVGLGYVGLPLAVALADHFDVTGFDIDATRVAEIRQGRDRTNEVDDGATRKARRWRSPTAPRRRAARISTSSPSRLRSTTRIGPIFAPARRDRDRRRPDRRRPADRPSSMKAPSIPA